MSLRVGRGQVAPVTSKSATPGTEGAGAGAGAGPGGKGPAADANTEKRFLRKRSGVVGQAWRRYVTAAAHGKPRPPTRAEADKENMAKQEAEKLQRQAELIARDRDKTARVLGGIRELGGLGRSRPVTVRVAYQAGTGGKIHSSYERSSLLRSSRATEAQHVSAAKHVPPTAVPGAAEALACAVERLAREKQPKPPAVPVQEAAGVKPKTFDQQLMPLPPRVCDPIIYFHR